MESKRVLLNIDVERFNLILYLAFCLNLIDLEDYGYFYRNDYETEVCSELPSYIGEDCYKDLKLFLLKNLTWVNEQHAAFDSHITLPTKPDSKWLDEYQDKFIEKWLDELEDVDLIVKHVICKGEEN
jgi:hypothetical protein